MDGTSDAPHNNSYQPRLIDFAALLTGNAVLALGAWLVRLSDTGPISAGFWRMVLPIPLIAFFAWREMRGRRVPLRAIALVVLAGIFFALDIASWHVGIELTTLGNSTLFGNAGSMILLFWGLIVLRRLPTRAETTAIAMALLGAAILLGRSMEVSMATVMGDLLSLLAGVFYVVYLIPVQSARSTMGMWSVLLVVSLVAGPVLLGFAAAIEEPVWPGAAGWGPLVALAVLSQIVGQGLLVYSLKHFTPLIIGLSLLIQPAVAAAIGWLAFREALTPVDMLGMALVAAALVAARSTQPAAAPAGAPSPAPVPRSSD